jgi:hypothetical protein
MRWHTEERSTVDARSGDGRDENGCCGANELARDRIGLQ